MSRFTTVSTHQRARRSTSEENCMDNKDDFSSASYESHKNDPRLEKDRLPDEGRIKWVEYELLRATFAGQMEKSALAESPEDIQVWLARKRDGKSWKEIGDTVYANKGYRPEARRTEARRAYARVELHFNDPS